ncbi:MMPL family transporter [Nocardioides sp. NPDC051685]|uniref:MMPL family transporter n=1 Tax=Nocardioides sp. NPDC051685 TaxID=3364334 RepID=UPI0037988101
MHRQIAGKLTGPRTKYLVVVLWLLALAVFGGFAGKLTDVQNNEASSWLPASAESTRGFDRMSPFQNPNAIPTTLVYTSSTTTGADLAEVASGDIAALGGLDGVEGEIGPPLLSKDGEVAQLTVTFDLGSDGWSKMPGIVDDIREIADHDGVRLHVTGQGGSAADAAEAFGGIDSTLLLAALVVVVVILLFVYRSPVLWVFPIVSVVVGLGVTMGLVYFLAKDAGLTVNGQSQAILSILAIGAGTDYALLLVSRYREELRNFEDRHEAMAHALHRAAPAILASAVTVILAMLGLTFAEMNSTSGMGPVVAVGIGVTYLVMVTLLPALLVICGRWVFWPKRPAYGSAEPTQTGLWAKVGAMVSVRPRAVWITTTVLLLIACFGLLRLDANGLASDETYTKEFDSIVGQQVLVDHDMADQSNQLLVVADAAAQTQVQQALDGVEGLVSTTTPEGEVKSFPLGPAQDGVVAIAAVVDADVTSPAAYDIVDASRSAVRGVEGSDALVTGTSAMMLDTLEASQRDNLVIIPIVLVVVLLVLMVLLRAVVAPLILLGTVILSFGAALGISVLLFEYVFGFAGTDPSFPLFAFVFLVALGIDYNIFLMTRVREEAQTRGTRAGSLVALTSTGGVITSAGVVLAATFLVLGSLPMVFLAEIGVTVALGVMLDTMIVRSILVTAINLDAGDRIWWPGRPAKL